MNNYQLVRRLISHITGRQVKEISPEDRLFQELEMDSVMCIELIIEFEKYGILINDDVITASLTVKELARII